MLHHGTFLHDITGAITWYWVSAKLGPDSFVGTLLWDWVASADRNKCRADMGTVLMGNDCDVNRYHLDEKKFGSALVAVVRFCRVPSSDAPILSIAYIVPSIVARLSPREREIAKLLPFDTSKEIAKKLKVSISTVETMRQRLAAKLGVSGNALVSWCALHREII